MTRLGGWRSTDTVAHARYTLMEPREATSVDLDVRLADEIIPFGCSRRQYSGAATRLAAESLIWGTDQTGAVFEDSEGRFHAWRTSLPRPGPADKLQIAPLERPRLPGHLVAFVVVPVMKFRASQPIPGEPCFVRQGEVAQRLLTENATRLAHDCAVAHKEWRQWWTTKVPIEWRIYQSDPDGVPPLPAELADRMGGLIASILGRSRAEVTVMTSPLDMPGDQVALNPFDDHATGTGGGDRKGGDLKALLAGTGAGEPAIVLRISANALGLPIPVLSVLQTAIHESAHYRHFRLALDHIRAWRNSVHNRSSLRSDRKAQAAFDSWMKRRLRRGEVTGAELTLVYSALGWNPGTHPAAQVEAFLGMYRHFPREIGDSARRIRLGNQVRFQQLMIGSPSWTRLGPDQPQREAVNVAEPRETTLKRLCVEAIAQHVKPDDCRLADMRHMGTEIRDSRAAGSRGRENAALPEAILGALS